MALQVQYNPVTGENKIVDVTPPAEDLETVRQSKLDELDNLYKEIIVNGFTSSATGSPVFYGYQTQDQLNYSKWANVLALDSTRDSVTIGSVSAGVVTMTRAQFLTFMADAESYELGLYNSKESLKQQIANAQLVDDLNNLRIVL